MYILHRISARHSVSGERVDPTDNAYLKYTGWAIFKDAPLDLKGCILFTKRETELNPPGTNEEYQYYGCYTSIKDLNK